MSDGSTDPTWRALDASDQPHLIDHYRRLGQIGLRSRFGRGVSPAFLDAYASESLAQASIVVGYFEADMLRAVGELRNGEIAFSVEAPWRERGIATAMAAMLCRSACAIGVGSIEIHCSVDNDAVKRLMNRLGFSLSREQRDVHGVLEMNRRLAA